ncbi:MAG: trimethylamine methyltransferase family protein [Desulfobacterales bacterium]|nr:trimethylamine methyltransferase family protein [Desulfobacterales bacterium]
MNHLINPISADQKEALHQASMTLLSKNGVVFMHDTAVAYFKQAGFKVDGQRVFITEDQVFAALETLPKTFEWTARDNQFNVTIGDGSAHVQPNAGAVYYHDHAKGKRKATIEDFSNIIKVCHHLDAVSLNGSLPVDPSDIPGEHKHLFQVRETLKHTDKPWIFGAYDQAAAAQDLEMAAMASGLSRLGQDHRVAVVVNPHSPLAFEPEGCEVIRTYSEANQILFMAPAIMAGMTGPIDLAGMSALQNAEILAGIVFTQLVRPGAPVVYATSSTVGDMRRASFCAGSPETMLINMPCLQLGREYYKIPVRTMCGLTEADQVNVQSGYETMMSFMFGFLGGASVMVQCLGTLEALMTTSMEKIVIDAELVARMQRFKQGPDFSCLDDSVKTMLEVGSTAGYIQHPDTFKKFRSLWSPDISVWGPSSDEDNVITRAGYRVAQILETADTPLVDDSLAGELDRYVDTHAN